MNRWLSCALVALAATLALIAVYGSSLAGPKVLDDGPVLAVASSSDDWFSTSGPLGRPVAMASFRLNLLTTGDAVVPLKATNLVLHLIVGFSLFVLFRKAFLHSQRSGGWLCSLSPTEFAAWLSVIWLLHPAHVSTVLYVTQRMAILSALFTALAILATLSFAESRDIGRRRMLVCLISTLLLLAAFSKETGLLAMPLIAVMSLAPRQLLGTHSNRWVLNAAVLASASLVVAMVVAFAQAYPGSLAETFSARGWSPVQRLLTETRVLSLYAEQTLVPRVSLFPFFYDWYPASVGLFAPTSTAVSVLAVIAGVLFVVRGPEELSLVRLGLAWFLVCHSLEASIWPLELVFEHRNYLASLGLVLSVIALLTIYVRRTPIVRLALAGWLLGILGVTALHASDWRSAAMLAVNAVRLQPESVAARSALAEAALAAGNPDAALRLLETTNSPALRLQGLYVACVETGTARWPDVLDDALIGRVPVNSHTTTSAVEVSRLVLDRKCSIDPERLASFIDTLSRLGRFIHASERERLLVYAMQLFDLADDHARAVGTGLFRGGDRAPSTHRLLLAAEIASNHGMCDDMNRALEQLPDELAGIEAHMGEATREIVAASICGEGRFEGKSK